MKRAMKLLIQYPAVYLTPMFTPFMFGPVISQPCLTASTAITESTATFTVTCFKSSCSSGKKNKRMHLSFLHTYFNTVIAGFGFYLSLLHFDENLFPLRGRDNKNPDLNGLYEEVKHISRPRYVYFCLPICFLTIIIFHLLETHTCCCCNNTIREELSMSQEEHCEELPMSQVENREGLSMPQIESCEELSMSQEERQKEDIEMQR